MRGRRIAGLAVLVVLLLAAPARAAQDPLQRYAEGTWASFVGMTDEQTGLPADFVKYDGTRSTPTSPTNIGAYLWSAVSAERLGIIDHRETVTRLGRTLTTLERMERGQGGQYFNWYDIRTGEISPTTPGGGEATPWLSSVDNGWLAVGLRIVADRVPELRARAQGLYDAMDFGFYYRADRNQILFHSTPRTDDEDPCCYDTIVSESRIASYVGIEKGELPPKHYYGAFRAFPDKCDIVETKPLGETRSYLGQSVFEGALPYAGTRVTPSWGGSMFEALMPSLFVPEERWGPGSWGINHPLTARAQIFHGLTEAGYGYWGFSPANKPEGGYDVYGVDGIGMDANGNASNEDKTLIDHGYEGCKIKDRPAVADPPQSAYTNGVVTPHASFLALRYAPREALANLRRLERDFPGMYGTWGFRDTVNVESGRVSDYYLSLDQGMVMAALGNALGGDVLRRAFVTRHTERALRPLLGVEEFGATPRGCTITGTSRADRLRGTRGDDVICGLGGDDRIDGGGGDDAIFGDAGADQVDGGGGADSLYGDDGADALTGGDGDDVLSGGPGSDRLTGGRGADVTEQG